MNRDGRRCEGVMELEPLLDPLLIRAHPLDARIEPRVVSAREHPLDAAVDLAARGAAADRRARVREGARGGRAQPQLELLARRRARHRRLLLETRRRARLALPRGDAVRRHVARL